MNNNYIIGLQQTDTFKHNISSKYLIRIPRNLIYYLCFIFIFTTETFSINFLGGNLRWYYVVSAAIVFVNMRYINQVINNRILSTLLVLILTLIITSITSVNISGAFISSISLMLNMTIAFATYLVLLSKKITLKSFDTLLYNILALNVMFGLLVLLLFKATGFSFGFTSFASYQLSSWQLAGFRSEANTHGKLVCFAVLYCLSHIINNNKKKKSLCLLLASICTLIISPTRSATYALLVTVLIAFVYYLFKKKSGAIIKYLIFCIIIVSVLLFLQSSGFINIEGYSSFKLNNFFVTNISEIQNDDSGVLRLESIQAAVDLWKESYITMFLGRGFCQTFTYLQGGTVYTKAGGIEILGVLAGVGIIGLLAWLNIFFVQLKSLLKKIKTFKASCQDSLKTWKTIAEFALFGTIYIFSIGFTSGIMFCPEMWLTFGLGAFLISNNNSKEESL